MKIFRTLFASAVLAALAITAGAMAGNADAKEWKKVRIGTEGAYPPFNSIDSAGKLIGFDIEISEALCAKMKVECTFVAQDWEGIIPALMAGKYDAIVASMFITEERKEKVNFTDPYYTAAMTFAAHKSVKVTDVSPAALKGKTIGAQGGTTQSAFLEELYKDSDLRFYPTQDEVNLELANGRLDLQVSDLIPMLEWTEKTDQGKCCELVGKGITDPKWVGDGVGIAIRKGDEDLLEMVNKALGEIVADGTYKKINDKYFSVFIYKM